MKRYAPGMLRPVHPATLPSALAERKRQLVRDELSEAALRLIAYQGFEETTIEQIVASAGVSRRTFFRYFQSKEDVIVALLGDFAAVVLAQLHERPAPESTAIALRRSFDGFVAGLDDDPDKSRRLAALVLRTPALAARYYERQYQWRAEFAAELARRTGVDPIDHRPALAGAVALAAFDTALARWIDGSTGQPLRVLVDEAFDHVTSALNG
jgi:AcrR family transcriptional regulator